MKKRLRKKLEKKKREKELFFQQLFEGLLRVMTHSCLYDIKDFVKIEPIDGIEFPKANIHYLDYKYNK